MALATRDDLAARHPARSRFHSRSWRPRAGRPRAWRATALAVALGAAAAAATGCGDSSVGTGTFTVELSNAPGRTYGGDALAASESGFGFAVVLDTRATQGPDQLSVFLVREQAGVPPAGNYVVADPATALATEFVLTLEVAANTVDEYICTSRSGTVTITSSSSRRVAGTMDVTVGCAPPSGGVEETVTMTGTFDAVVTG